MGVRGLGVAVALLGGAAAASMPVPLDDARVRSPESISVAALGDEALVTWNSTGPMPFSIYWTVLDGTGAPKNAPDAGPLGEFSFHPPHVAAAPDAGLWLVVHPDKSGGGTTGAARIAPARGSLDGYGFAVDNTVTYTNRVRAAWGRGAWWVAFRNSGGAWLASVDATALTTVPVALPQVGVQDFELAATESAVYLAWPGDAGWPTVDGLQGASSFARRELPEASRAVAVAAQRGVVLLAWATGTEVRFHRFDETLSSLDNAPMTLDVGEVATPRVSADDTSFLVVWTRTAASGSVELRLGRVPLSGPPPPPATVRAATLQRPDVAGAGGGAPFVAWLELGAGGWLPYAQRVGVATVDAGAPDAGIRDAGNEPPDAGAGDAGNLAGGNLDAGGFDAGIPDAGAPEDAGVPDSGAADAGAGEPARYTVGAGCATAPGGLLAGGLLLLALGRRARRRAPDVR